MGRPCGAPVVLLAAVVVSCRGRESAPADSAPDSTMAARAVAMSSDWVSELGPMLVVPADTDNSAVVLFPPAPTAGSMHAYPLTILSAAGESATSRAELVVSDSQVCGEASTIRLLDRVPEHWSIGMRTLLSAVRMDSIEALRPADSAKFAADLARLASAVPEARASRFAGLPFIVLTAKRFTGAGRQTAAAHLLRRLPQEATPLEEHFLVLGERSATSLSDPLALVYHLRSEGTEDTADHYEVLAALEGDSATYLIVSRDRESQTRYDVLARDRVAWRIRWSRTLAC